MIYKDKIAKILKYLSLINIASYHNTKINYGNYNESIQGDYLETKTTSNNGSHTVIQKAEKVFIGGEKKFNTSYYIAKKQKSKLFFNI